MKKTAPLLILLITIATFLSAQSAALYIDTVNQQAQTIDVWLDTPGEVAGFQFELNGVELCTEPACISGGSSGAPSWMLSVGESGIVLGFTFGVAYIPQGDALLVTLTYNAITGPELTLSNVVISGPPGLPPYPVEIGPPYVFIDGPVFGCTDPSAMNFDPEATTDNGSCQFADIFGCMDPTACNYNPEAGNDDGSCEFESCVDCAGVYAGDAFIDDCGVCSGGTTGHWANIDMDACGVCFGDGSGCISELYFGNLDQSAHTLELWLNTSTEISSFSIRITGINLLTFSGGILGELPDWTFDLSMAQPDPSVYYDFSGESLGADYIPVGEHLLTIFSYDHLLATSVCFSFQGSAFYGPEGYPASVTLGSCLDLLDQPILGCTDPLACNYNPYAVEDNGLCEYESCYDCAGQMGGFGVLDDCGICSGGTSDHVANSDMDCAGECFGEALPDDCGVCSGGISGHEPDSDMDCAGVCFGTAEADVNGLCCQNEEIDCAGICFGQAFVDDCQICSGGTSGHEANSDMDACGVCFGNALEPGPDCNGEYCGGAYINECGYCVGGSSRFDRDYGMDCAGVCDGEAFIDDCGVCSGGTSGHEANSDMDCLGDCFGWAFFDEWGNCVNDDGDSFNADLDCNGVYFGNSVIDDCGNCVLPDDFNAAMDDCGVCNGNNADMDCNGDCFGTAILNDCGCVGGNTGLEADFCIPPSSFTFNQSTLQAYYFIANATLDGVELVPGEDWIIAYNGDVIAGAVAWSGSYTTLPTMGDDGDEATAGYFQSGDIPDIRIYDGSSGELYETTATSVDPQLAWEINGLSTIDLLEAVLRETQSRELHAGSNLVGFQVIPDDLYLSLVLSGLTGNCFGVIGEGVAAQPNPIQPGEWVGSLVNFDIHKGYWIKMWDADTLEIQGPAIGSDITYDLHSGANLISYPFFSSLPLEMAIPYEFWQSIIAIISEGEAAIPNPFTEDEWIGSLTEFIGGHGYWMILDQALNYHWNEGTLTRSEQFAEPSSPESMPEELAFSQSTRQAFYFVELSADLSQSLTAEDWLAAVCDGQIVGARRWSGPLTDIPAMGTDGSPETAGYCEQGAAPEFKLYRPGTDEWIPLYGNIPRWQENAVFRISGLGDYPAVPVEYGLSQPRPNPFNPVTTFSYALPVSAPVELSIYDLSGRLVETLVREQQSPGEYEVEWNAREASSGVYLVTLKTGETLLTRKMILLK
ncbi:MAG: T9SS type A sorting domain-containing protein [FCB group bacterium]|nr:T9SS type A sorting domain-containing protein [FCB group bacterium]